ncbi:MAG: hypothetical protein NT040_18210 [Bacteroidetes bacterium]|nr:hypothetical protein [Bacteroidota bacterium]
MTKVKLDGMFDSMSGRSGKKHIFRNMAGQTIMSRMPKVSVKTSKGQEGHRELFKKAVKYAILCKDDPVLWEKYLNSSIPGISAYNLALGDYLSSPVISELDVEQYAGHPGNVIVITAVDKFEVVGVTVRIEKPDGTLLEEGPAFRRNYTNYYVYAATEELLKLDGIMITASATDNPGHVVTKVVTL